MEQEWPACSFKYPLVYVISDMTLCKYYPYSDFAQTVSSHIRTEYEDLQSKPHYSVQMQKNTNQNNSKHGHFSQSILASSRQFYVMRYHLIIHILSNTIYAYFFKGIPLLSSCYPFIFDGICFALDISNTVSNMISGFSYVLNFTL